MVERKSTKTVAKKATVRKTATKKAAAKSVVALNAENAGFKAGDVYQALAAADGKALTVAEIAKAAKISNDEALLGLGWLFKEGKIKDDNNKVVLA